MIPHHVTQSPQIALADFATSDVFETFLLARDIRVTDMAASAYDLADWGVEPVRVETAEGRSEYARRQREFAERAAPLRARLIGGLEPLLRDPARTGHGRYEGRGCRHASDRRRGGATQPRSHARLL